MRPRLLSCTLLLCGCVKTTLDVPDDHPGSLRYPTAPVSSAAPLASEAPPKGAPASGAHDHSHHHHHGEAPPGHP